MLLRGKTGIGSACLPAFCTLRVAGWIIYHQVGASKFVSILTTVLTVASDMMPFRMLPLTCSTLPIWTYSHVDPSNCRNAIEDRPRFLLQHNARRQGPLHRDASHSTCHSLCPFQVRRRCYCLLRQCGHACLFFDKSVFLLSQYQPATLLA